MINNKICDSLTDAIKKSGLKDGMTISFHHHFRTGDLLISQVLKVIEELGIKDLKIAASAIVNLDNVDFIHYIENGTITSVEASGIRGELGNYILKNGLKRGVTLRPHGGRARAIQEGSLKIDVAFVGASSADEFGNATGAYGKNVCGTLSYPMIDVQYATKSIVITDNLVPYPCEKWSVTQDNVDYVVVVDEIGDASKIGVGAARISNRPLDLEISRQVVDVIKYSGYFKEGFSFQTGAGAIAIACTDFLRKEMEKEGIKASFALGGVTSYISEMLEEGLVQNVLAVQSFDANSAKVLFENQRMIEIDSGKYANPNLKGCSVNMVNVGILGALEVDTDFNVNLLVGSNGKMLSGIGGGPDVAAGVDLSIIAVPINRKRTPSVVDKVFTKCTPGKDIAVVVTEAGIALNPKHKNYEFLKNNLEKSSLDLKTIEELRDIAYKITGKPSGIETTDEVVANVEDRYGDIIDVIKKIKY